MESKKIQKNIFFISVPSIKKYSLNIDLIVKNHEKSYFLTFNRSFFYSYNTQIFTYIIYECITHTYIKLIVILQCAGNKK